MKTGAVIAAAGLSSRMGAFKPMLEIGDTTAVRRIITVLRSVGADPIVLVTGHRAEALEAHVADLGVICVRNEQYSTTDMFASVSLGMARICTLCDQFFFTPVDVPLFSPETARALLACGAPLCKPVCSGRDGHPLLIRSDLAKAILRSGGEGGLKGALSRCGCPVTAVFVDDEGAVHDADTPEEFRLLVQRWRDGGGKP